MSNLNFTFMGGTNPLNSSALIPVIPCTDVSFAEPHLFEKQNISVCGLEAPEIKEEEELEYSQTSSMRVIPKSSLEIEIERIQAEKRELMRYKRKQQRLYQRIREEHRERIINQKMAQQQESMMMMSTDGMQSKDLVNSYVQKALSGITEEQKEQIREEVRKRDIKLKQKKLKRKTLTVQAPFQLRTSSRIKVDEIPSQQTYEPLWLQVQKSFQLRDATNTVSTHNHEQLTRPKSPTLHTLQRNKLKDDLTLPPPQEQPIAFKARPFNPKIFEKKPIPISHQDTRTALAFEEFSLSHSNASLAKKTLLEYQQEKENPKVFKATPLNKKILEQAPITPQKSSIQTTTPQGFSFKIDERLAKKSEKAETSQETQRINRFKARAMPKYKFFKIADKSPSKEPIIFKEFKLHTASIKPRSVVKISSEPHEDKTFHAQPMPNFSEVKLSCSKKEVPALTQPEPFALSTINRGEEKRARLQQQVEEERKKELELAKFKAREFNLKDTVKPLIKPSSGKTTPSIPFKLHSVMRSQQREEFDKKMKEKEVQLSQAEQERLLQIKEQEEQEVKLLRQQMIFKAGKIRKYRFVMPDTNTNEARSLTVPQAPKLQTESRAHLKDE